MAKAKQQFPGWQTMDSAAKRHRVTRQRIHQITQEREIDTMQVFHYRLVPDPFPFHDVKNKGK